MIQVDSIIRPLNVGDECAESGYEGVLDVSGRSA